APQRQRFKLRCAPLTHSKTCYSSSVVLGLGVSPMRRREFIALLGSGVAAWPLVARAQQAERMRRIGMLMNRVADDPEAQARFKAFVQGLQQLGWAEGRNVRMDVRWTAGVTEHLHRYAAELVAIMPDVILADGAVGVSALQGATRSVPVVFVAVPPPVGARLL